MMPASRIKIFRISVTLIEELSNDGLTEVFKTIISVNSIFIKVISTLKLNIRAWSNNILAKKHKSAIYGDKTWKSLKTWNELS